jgi:glucose/arabinose dehydrogenase
MKKQVQIEWINVTRVILGGILLFSLMGSNWLNPAKVAAQKGFEPDRRNTDQANVYAGDDSNHAYMPAPPIHRNVNEPAVLSLDPARIQMNLVAGGLVQPLIIANAGDGSGRIFIAEKAGIIRVLSNGTLMSLPFLDMQSIVNSTAGEQGLLALTFHPQYESNGYFYTVHTNASGSVVLSRFTTSPANSNQANLNSRVELLVIPHPTHTNHNGGTLAFGPDGYLYWSTGDGGGAGDPFDNAQNLTSLLGKILRLDVDSSFPYANPATNPFFNHANPSVRKEIWGYGLRNPWRISFDRLTHDIYIGDVGQGSREEIDFQAANSQGGENYGWDVMEGSVCYNATTCDQSNKILPVAEYTHAVGCSVTGGYVYRGVQYPSLTGHYLYADYCQGKFFELHYTQANGWVSNPLPDTTYNVSTFGEDEEGELYFADLAQGRVYQIGYVEPTFSDVPASHPYYQDIETLYANGLTGGCSTTPLMFCPDTILNRAQAAVFMLRGNFGVGYTPPSVVQHIFADDWSLGLWAEPWAEGMYNRGLTAGCWSSPLQFCPWDLMPREQAAVFGLRLKYGNAYTPPPALGTVFADLTNPNFWSTAWAEQAYADGLIPACGTSGSKPLFCPGELVSRGFGAYIIVRAKNLVMP